MHMIRATSSRDFFFFFSSRRRHTRCSRDWSSDVCSSDLVPGSRALGHALHLSWTTASALPVLVANGVTGVRDMGGRLSEIDEWRTKIAAGLLVGPRIVRAGPMLNGQKFNSYQMVPGNPDETRGVVRALREG